ncbi:MAG: TM2 domain-containing protein [Bacteroidales bacterium]|nr:TM2 domain-containing protein [Bacteroidales bacterium]
MRTEDILRAQNEKQEAISTFMGMFQNYFTQSDLEIVRKKLETLDIDVLSNALGFVELYNPTRIFLFSLFLGALGVDRFMIEDGGVGFLKLFTCGGAGILWGLDLLLIQRAARKRNVTKLQLAITRATKEIKEAKENERKAVQNILTPVR